MKKFRQIVFWMHLSAGVVAGLVILLMSVTGVLLTFERQIVRSLDDSVPVTSKTRAPIDSLVAAIVDGQARPVDVNATYFSECRVSPGPASVNGYPHWFVDKRSLIKCLIEKTMSTKFGPN